ncbi:MAG: hydroxymethylglutaryl-CoA lyase [Actinomycetia bacterium]|nr:hydroxymethylglutaryl-CoA lyase [Actinomycetes bacterium]
MQNKIQIVEVGPRDGLQNEAEILSTDDKLLLIDHLVASGIRRIEAVSFAHPKHVPQLADAEAVMAGINKHPDVSYIGLVMNWRGWLRAVETDVDEVNIPLFASNTFNMKNQGVPTSETIDVVRDIAGDAHKRDIYVTATIGTAWGCPFEGEVPTDAVIDAVAGVAAAGVDEIAIADTIGVADPWSVTQRLTAIRSAAGEIPLRVHFHDTRHTGIANTYAAIEAGVTTIDASVGGIGGCPFAPAATGNIATDDLVYMLNRGGFEHGVSLASLIGVSQEVESLIHKPVPAMLPVAGDFPPA